jgi:hypothetical protein
MIGARCRTLFIGLFFFLAVPSFAQPQTGHLTAADAKNHIGERATVCGNVVSTHYAARSKGSPTFMNLDEPFPKEIFTILIWGSDRAKFGDPETKYANRKVCVTGLIKDYKGTPEVVAEQPSQIETQN